MWYKIPIGIFIFQRNNDNTNVRKNNNCYIVHLPVKPAEYNKCEKFDSPM